MKHLIITKDKVAPVVKAQKRPYQWLQDKDFDMRPSKKPPTDKEIALFVSRMNSLNTEYPVFPLFNKLYPTKHKPSTLPTIIEDRKTVSIMARNVTELLRDNESLDPIGLFSLLKFASDDITSVNELTIQQWQCEEWYKHKQGFLSASKWKSYYTRQKIRSEGKCSGICKLAKESVTIATNLPFMKGDDATTPREWGLPNEKRGRDAYKSVQDHLHTIMSNFMTVALRYPV